MIENTYRFFLQLVRLGIGTSKEVLISNKIHWEILKALAEAQGLSAVVLDGIEEARSKRAEVRS